MDSNGQGNRMYGGIKMSERAADIIVAVTALILLLFIVAAVVISV